MVLVEGWSDQAAVEALAYRMSIPLQASGTVVLPMGGATNVGHFVIRFGQRGRGLRLAGLYDLAEESHVLRALADDQGTGTADRDDAERLGFFVCAEDLEDEMIRGLGTDAVQTLIAAEGELPSFRRFQAQPQQARRPLHAQLRRFIGTRSGRKIRYGGLLANSLELPSIPRPLALLLTYLECPPKAPAA